MWKNWAASPIYHPVTQSEHFGVKTVVSLTTFKLEPAVLQIQSQSRPAGQGDCVVHR